MLRFFPFEIWIKFTSQELCNIPVVKYLNEYFFYNLKLQLSHQKFEKKSSLFEYGETTIKMMYLKCIRKRTIQLTHTVLFTFRKQSASIILRYNDTITLA